MTGSVRYNPLVSQPKPLLLFCDRSLLGAWMMSHQRLTVLEAGIGSSAESRLPQNEASNQGVKAIAPSPNVTITYCRLCNWLLRAAWMGQELLSTFAEELGSLTLIPNDQGGVFEVRIDGELIWSRSAQGRFPEIKELKQLVRDKVAPARDLGHVEAKDPKSKDA